MEEKTTPAAEETPAVQTVSPELSPEEQIEAWTAQNEGQPEENEESSEESGKEPEEQAETPEEPEEAPVEPPAPEEKPEEKPEEPEAKSEESTRLDELKATTEEFLKGIDDEWSRKQLGKVLELAAEVGAEQAVARINAKTEEEQARIKAEQEAEERQKQEHSQQQIAEMEQAAKEKRIPEIKTKAPVGSEDWLKDEGVKVRQEILKFQSDFNQKLEQKGSKWRVESFEQALELWEKDKITQEQNTAEERANDAQRQAGAKVLAPSGTGQGGSTQSFYTPGASLEEVHSRALDALQGN